MKHYPKIECRVCGNEIIRTPGAGRPRKTHVECVDGKPVAKPIMAVNVNEPDEPANFIVVSSEKDEFWNAMAAKALLRRAASESATASDNQEK